MVIGAMLSTAGDAVHAKHAALWKALQELWACLMARHGEEGESLLGMSSAGAWGSHCSQFM